MKKTILIAASLLFPLLLPAQPQRYYVDQAAAGQNNGQSWPDAFTDLHDALALAIAGDEIWVAGGIYHPGAAGERAARFEMLSGVKLYGGFAGTELDMSERDLAASATVLDGDIGVPGDSTDNSYNLLYLYRPDSLTVVDGFTFRYALANDPAAAAGAVGSSGAALYIMAVDGAAYPLIRHCIFEHNSARWHGGAAYVNGGGSGSVAPVFRQCHFTSNRAVEGNGGALYRNGGSWIDKPEDIDGCVFEENLANRQGGAIFFADSPRSDVFDIKHTVLQHNQLIVPNAGMGFNSGSALFATSTRVNGATTVSFRCSKIIDNRSITNYTVNAAPFGTTPQWVEVGNLILNFDSVYFERNVYTYSCESFGWTRISINNSTFYKDTIGTNITSEVDYDTSRVMNTKFIQCIGGIVPHSATLYIENVTCAYSRNAGFGMLFMQSNTEIIANNLVAYGNTFSSPNYGDGPRVLLSPDVFSTWDQTVRLNNSSAFDNLISVGYTTNHIYYNNNAFFLKEDNHYPYYDFAGPNVETAVFDHNLFNFPDTFDTGNWIKTGNIWATDPQFMNPDSGDFRLQPCSPAIDAGNNAAVITATDIAGTPRIQAGTVDIGAYESPAFGLSAEPGVKGACNGEPNGAIEVSLLSACEPLDVSWQSGAQAGTALSGLAPGAYQVTVTDAKGHSLAFSAAVPAADPPILQVDGSPVSCFGADDASLSVKPLSGQPPFAYLWSPAGTTDSLATGLSPGPASVTVTDAWGCTSSFSFNIPQPDTLQFTATVQDATGQQIADGSIAVNGVAGGTPPYGYLWSPGGSAGDLLAGLLPGFYTLTVTDQRGCEAVWIFEVKFTSGTKEGEGQAVLLIYPNPAGESTVLSTDFRDRPALLEMYDAAGRPARSAELPTGSISGWSISLEGLAAGYYTLLLRDAVGKPIGTGKLIKK